MHHSSIKFHILDLLKGDCFGKDKKNGRVELRDYHPLAFILLKEDVKLDVKFLVCSAMQ